MSEFSVAKMDCLLDEQPAWACRASVVKAICRQDCPAALTMGVKQARKKPHERGEDAGIDSHAISVKRSATHFLCRNQVIPLIDQRAVAVVSEHEGLSVFRLRVGNHNRLTANGKYAE